MILYQSSKGRQVSAHSYSGGLDFSCPKKYFWKRLQGWVEKDERAALSFGKAFESAIQFHHAQNFEQGTGINEFRQIWVKEKDNPEISYGEKEGSWGDLYKCGSELLALYEIMRPRLPLDNAVFQQKIVVPLFPGTEYDGLEHLSFLDIVAEPRWDHPLLPKIPENGQPRKIICDIKSSSSRYFSDPRLASLDRQLREYSWATGIETVCFLVGVKNITEPSSGQYVTLLQNFGGLEAGESYIVLDIDESFVIVLEKKVDYDEYRRREGEVKGKGATAAKQDLLTEYVFKGFRVPRELVTKCSLQFLPALISEQARQDAGENLKKEAIEIADCNTNGNFPQKSGVRYPHATCNVCSHLGLCLQDEKMTREKLVQIGEDF
jgi:hypothetical protein